MGGESSIPLATSALARYQDRVCPLELPKSQLDPTGSMVSSCKVAPKKMTWQRNQFTTAGLKQKTRKEMSDYNAVSLWQPSLIQAARVRHGKAQFASIVQGDFGMPLVKPVVRNDRLIPECGNFVIMLQRPFHHVPDILTRDIHGIGLIESLQEALPSTIANVGFLHL